MADRASDGHRKQWDWYESNSSYGNRSGQRRRGRKWKGQRKPPASQYENACLILEHIRRQEITDLMHHTAADIEQMFETQNLSEPIKGVWREIQHSRLECSSHSQDHQATEQRSVASSAVTSEGQQQVSGPEFENWRKMTVLQRPSDCSQSDAGRSGCGGSTDGQQLGTSRLPTQQSGLGNIPSWEEFTQRRMANSGMHQTKAVGQSGQASYRPKLQWHDFDTPEVDNMGRFFLNKAYLHKDKSQFWKPPHLNGTRSKLMGFEDLVPMAGLQAALVVNQEWFGTMLEYLCQLPASASCTVVCAKKVSTGGCGSLGSIVLCPQHSLGNSAKYIEETGEVTDCECECPAKRSVTLIHPDRDEQLRCHFLLLRYEKHARFVLTSAAFNPTSWERFSHFGWYCDLPIVSGSPGKTHPFKAELANFLNHLGASVVVSELVEPLDCSSLSPLVQLVCSVPQTERLRHGKFYSLREEILWPGTQRKMSVIQTCQLSAAADPSLKVLFSLDHSSSKPTSKELKIVFPSARRGKEIKEQNPNMTDEMVKGIYENHFDSYMDAERYLHDVDSEVPLYSMSNIVKQHQVVRSEVNSDLDSDDAPYFGWLLTGSHVPVHGCLGVSRSQRYRDMEVHQYDLSLGLFPYHDRQAGLQHVVDLRLVGLPFHKPKPYHFTDYPFSPASSERQRLFHCIGVFGRVLQKRKLGFIDELPPDDPVRRNFDAFPCTLSSDGSHSGSAGVVLSLFQAFSMQRQPEVGSLIEFVGFLKGSDNMQAVFRVMKIIRVFDGFVSNQCPPLSPVSNLLHDCSAQVENNASALLYSHAEATKYYGPEFMLGITTEEQMDQFWSKKFGKAIAQKRSSLWPQTQAEIDAKFPMNPTRLMDGMTWLEKHVRQIYSGHIPPMVGPYNMEVLKVLKVALKSQLLEELPLGPSTPSDKGLNGGPEVLAQVAGKSSGAHGEKPAENEVAEH